MRTTIAFITAILATNTPGFSQNSTSSVAYATPDRGGMLIETAGGTNPPVVGYARVQSSASTVPSAAAIYDLRQNGVLTTEAGVPGMTAITSGRTYGEVNPSINTGIAFANP